MPKDHSPDPECLTVAATTSGRADESNFDLMSSAAIVGGGIGGLAGAIALDRVGWDVTVFEKAPALGEVGAGITLWPNALAALDALGVGPTIRKAAIAQPSGGVRGRSGRVLIEQDLTDPSGPAASVVALHRADLVDVLAESIPAESLRLGQSATVVDPDGRIEFGGHTETFDLVVAADGVHSSTRSTHWPGEGAPRRTGIRAWRWVVDHPPGDFIGTVWARQAEFGIVPLPNDRTYVFAAASGDLTLDHFRSWPDPVGELVRIAENPIEHDLLELRVPKSLAYGRIALIGDAAHTLRPHLGQGAGLAIEDAVTLAAHAPDLVGYSKARRRRVQAVSLIARAASPVLMPRGKATTAARDGLVRAAPDRLFLAPLTAINRWRPPRS